MFPKIPNIAERFRDDNLSVFPDLFRELRDDGCVSTPLPVILPTFRHPGLAPGPIQKGRDLKTTLAGRSLRSWIYAARFRDDNLSVFPDLFRDLFKKAVI